MCSVFYYFAMLVQFSFFAANISFMVFCAIIFGFCYGLYCWKETLKINKVYYIFTLILKPFIWLGYKKLNINNSSISPAIWREREALIFQLILEKMVI